MRRALGLAGITVLTLAVAGAQSNPALEVINAAAKALGGLQRLQSTNIIAMEGGGMANNLGQARTPRGDDPDAPTEPTSTFEVTGFKRVIDVANLRAQQQWHRTPKFASPNPDNDQNVGLDGDVAFSINANSQATPQGGAVAKARRFELILSHPIGIIRVALAPSAKVGNLRRQGNDDVVDITTAKGDTVTLAVNRTTHRPASVSMPVYQNYLGDSVSSAEFLDYQDVGGVKLPVRIRTRLNNWIESDYTFKNTVNPKIDLAAPAGLQTAGASGGAGRGGAGGQGQGNVIADEIGKGLWFLTGAGENSALVEFADHTELVEVPLGEARAEALFSKAHELVPTKPLTRAIVTHAHFDHSGGIRRVIAEGLTVVAHQANRSFFEKVAARKHTIQLDEQARNPKAPKFDLVSDAGMIEKDATRTLQIIKFDDPTGHNAYMLMVYFPNEKALFNADLFNWGGNFVRYPRAVALNEAIQKHKLNVAMHLPVHGKRGERANFESVLAALREGRQPPGLGLLQY